MMSSAEKGKRGVFIADAEEESKYETQSAASFTYSDAGFDEDNEILDSYQQKNDNTTYRPHEGSLPLFDKLDRFPHASMLESDSMQLAIIYLVVLTSDMSRGLLFPTLWLVVHAVGGGPSEQGLAVSAFSLGRLVSTTAVGYLSEKYGCRLVLCLCNIVIILGACIYIFVASSGVAGVESVILAQLVIGIGAGSLGATRGYVAEKTPREKRTEQLAIVTALQYGGFTVTPIIGALISSYFTTGSTDNTLAYTMPVVFLIFFAAVCALLLFFFFLDDKAPHAGGKGYQKIMEREISEQSIGFESPRNLEVETEKLKNETELEMAPLISAETIPSKGVLQRHDTDDTIGFVASPHIDHKHRHKKRESIGLNKIHSFASVSSDGFVHSPISKSPFHHQQASKYDKDEVIVGKTAMWWLSVAGCIMNIITKGTISVFETLTVMFLTEHFHWDSLKSGLTISMCGIVGVGFLLSFPILLRYFQDIDLVLFGLAIMVVSCMLVDSVPFIGQKTPDTYGRSEEERIYLALVLMFAIGYPIGHTALIGAFSKINKSGPQGTMMGIFGSCGSVARIIFPTLAGIIASQLGFGYAFLFTAIALVVSMMIMAWYRKLIHQILQHSD